MSLGETYAELTIKIKSAHHQPPEPDVGLMHGSTEVEEIEIFLGEKRIKNETLEEFFLEEMANELNEIAAEAHNDEMRDAADAKGDHEYEMLLVRR